MKRRVQAVTALAIVIATPACAAPSCYPPAAYRADTVLRYQAMLRATALSCGFLADGNELLKDYQLFTQNNSKLITDSQSSLDRFYDDGAEGSHQRETEMQNAQAAGMAAAGTARSCRADVPALRDAVLDSQGEVDAAVEDFARHNPAALKRCR